VPQCRARTAELAAKNRPAAESRVLVLVLLWITRSLLALLLGIELAERSGKIQYPRAKRWRLTDYGWQCTVKSAPRTGRKEVEKQAAHIADYWRSVRVGVTQVAPGRIVVRALRADPLAQPFGPELCPPGTYEPHQPEVLYVGRDDFGADRYLPLRGLTGICVSGLPGYGKTSLISSWLCQLTATPAAQFALLDGKNGGDQEPWHDRAWRHCGDQLADALDVLEDAHAEMRRRLRAITALCGQRNAWNASGPTENLPLLVTVIDECQTYLDLAQHKGDRALEGLARRCIALVGELIRKGRSVLCLTILATQKTTGDSIPTSLRDNSGLAVSFALKTTESSVNTPATARPCCARHRPGSAPPSPPSPPAPTHSRASASPRSPSIGPPNAPPPPSATAATRESSSRLKPSPSCSSHHHSPERSNCHGRQAGPAAHRRPHRRVTRHVSELRSPPHRRAQDPVRPRWPARANPRVRVSRVHRGRHRPAGNRLGAPAPEGKLTWPAGRHAASAHSVVSPRAAGKLATAVLTACW
jgi:S-DNA-T family DNA segregation ATPase FtsK/SpoIIIE